MTDKAFINGKIYTVNEKQPMADTVVTGGNKIRFVGRKEDARDFVVLNNDILTIDPAEIISVKVDRTIFDGEVIYQRAS